MPAEAAQGLSPTTHLWSLDSSLTETEGRSVARPQIHGSPWLPQLHQGPTRPSARCAECRFFASGDPRPDQWVTEGLVGQLPDNAGRMPLLRFQVGPSKTVSPSTSTNVA